MSSAVVCGVQEGIRGTVLNNAHLLLQYNLCLTSIITCVVTTLCHLGHGGCNSKGMKMKEVTSTREQSKGSLTKLWYSSIHFFFSDVLKGRPELMKSVANMVCKILFCILMLAHH